MPDNPSNNRERLLRLIDGGHEALKEFQEPIKVPPAPKKPVQLARLLVEWKAKALPVSQKRLRPALFVLGGLVLAGWLFRLGMPVVPGLEAVKAIRQDEAGTAGAETVENQTGLRLVGVDTSEPPVALLEDLKTGKTYFVRVNERVREARVKQIEKNRVTVTVRGKTVELR